MEDFTARHVGQKSHYVYSQHAGRQGLSGSNGLFARQQYYWTAINVRMEFGASGNIFFPSLQNKKKVAVAPAPGPKRGFETTNKPLKNAHLAVKNAFLCVSHCSCGLFPHVCSQQVSKDVNHCHTAIDAAQYKGGKNQSL